MTTTILFPGQGSQYPGMSRALVENFPDAKVVFEEASEAIKENLLRLTLDGPEDKLQLTENAQPAILTTAYAWFKTVQKETGIVPSAGAGHSLGEYTALLAAEALTLNEAVRLVRTRGQMMQTAVPEGKGKMAAALGLSDDKIEELCRAASTKDSVVVPANFNSPGQIVISGHKEAVERAETMGAQEPFKARKMIPLKVSAPFHSPLMKAIVEPFSAHLKAVKWSPLRFPIAFNVDAKLRQEADVIELLTTQLYSPVRWTQCVQTLRERVGDVFLEVGPGKVLTGLVKRILEKPKLFSVESVEELRALEKAWQEENRG